MTTEPKNWEEELKGKVDKLNSVYQKTLLSARTSNVGKNGLEDLVKFTNKILGDVSNYDVNLEESWERDFMEWLYENITTFTVGELRNKVKETVTQETQKLRDEFRKDLEEIQKAYDEPDFFLFDEIMKQSRINSIWIRELKARDEEIERLRLYMGEYMELIKLWRENKHKFGY